MMRSEKEVGQKLETISKIFLTILIHFEFNFDQYDERLMVISQPFMSQ